MLGGSQRAIPVVIEDRFGHVLNRFQVAVNLSDLDSLPQQPVALANQKCEQDWGRLVTGGGVSLMVVNPEKLEMRGSTDPPDPE